MCGARPGTSLMCPRRATERHAYSSDACCATKWAVSDAGRAPHVPTSLMLLELMRMGEVFKPVYRRQFQDIVLSLLGNGSSPHLPECTLQ